jgi:hypothetical protein
MSPASKYVRKWLKAFAGIKQGQHRRPSPLRSGCSIFNSPDLLSGQARLKERI